MNIYPPTKFLVYGVDFSGAENACKKIWISHGIIIDNALQIRECWPLKDELKNGFTRDRCLSVLLNLIESKPNAAFGLDFPFGLPKALSDANNWEIFLQKFSKQYQTPDHFRQDCLNNCLNKIGKKEQKRRTDKESQSPFCVYNLRMYKQTYYGIRDVLFPLIQNDSASVLPMQSPKENRPWIFEICPASTLKYEGLYCRYKGKKDKELKQKNRSLILNKLIQKRLVSEISSNVWEVVLRDTEGDALDSVVASVATFRALKNLTLSEIKEDSYKIEGYIYI